MVFSETPGLRKQRSCELLNYYQKISRTINIRTIWFPCFMDSIDHVGKRCLINYHCHKL